MKYSVVVPVYNEVENLPTLWKHLLATLESMGQPFEIIFVDDASTDGSFQFLEAIAGNEKRVKVVQFRRNSGQTAALAAGFQISRGEILITLDADNQNDPRDIPRLIEKMEEGFDLVTGWRKNRQDHYWTRIFPSQIANRLISAITGVAIKDIGCTLKVYRTDLLKEVRIYGEMHRFLPVYMAWEGARIAEVEVEHRPRLHGVSNYSLMRVFKVILDLIMVKFLESYSAKPNYVFGGLGAILGVGGVSLAFTGQVLRIQRAGLMGGIFLVIGIQFLMMGILAELIIRDYYESNKIPIFKIRRKINVD